MWDFVKLFVLAAIAIFAAYIASYARDLAHLVHMVIIMLVAGGLFVWQIRRVGEPAGAHDPTQYMDGVIRFGVIA
ncbi:MAG: cytochrome-c oxidase, cbb3-type subunit I, partial [Rhodobacteraceae bacterium]